jgi:hypothetical protein
MMMRFAGDDSVRRGRPKTKIDRAPPEGFQTYDDLTKNLDAGGWYLELAGRQRCAFVFAHYKPEDWPRLKPDFEAGYGPIIDPLEMDRVMGRAEPVAKVETPQDLEAAQFNRRLVIDLDPGCLDDVLFPKINDLLKAARREREEEKEKERERERPRARASTKAKAKPNRHISFEAWANHKILALYDLQLTGYDLMGQRKQLAEWLFPEIADPKARGDKYDRARVADGSFSRALKAPRMVLS